MLKTMLSVLHPRYSLALRRFTFATNIHGNRFRHKLSNGFCQNLEKPVTPQCPQSRYIKEMEPKIKVENPHYTSTEIKSRAREMWRGLDRAEKRPYKQACKVEFDKYLEARLLYECSVTDDQRAATILKEERALQKKRRLELTQKLVHSGKPSKPSTAFMFFLSDMTDKCSPNETRKRWVSKVGTMWHNLTPEEKEKYLAMAREVRKDYQKGTDKWGDKIIKDFDKWDEIQKIAGSNKIRFEQVEKLWNKLSRDEQKVYIAKAERLYQNYLEEMQERENQKKTSFDKWVAEVAQNRNL